MPDDPTLDGPALERERLAIERLRYELDRDRLERDKALDSRPMYRHLGVITATVVGLLGIVVSGAQVWVAQITRDKEIEITRLKNDQDARRLEGQHEKDWNLQVTKFVYDNRQGIFAGSETEREMIANLLRATFPPDVYDKIFGRLAASTRDKDTKAFWERSQAILANPATGETASITPKVTAEQVDRISKTTRSYMYRFSIWLDVAPAERDTIREVQYYFDHPSFGADARKISRDAQRGFPTGYEGWGAISSVDVKVIHKDGRTQALNVNMIRALGW